MILVIACNNSKTYSVNVDTAVFKTHACCERFVMMTLMYVLVDGFGWKKPYIIIISM